MNPRPSNDDEGFNPRAHVGRDPAAWDHPARGEVSIHAPTWGATTGCNSRFCRGRFQSTRPRGARPISPSMPPAVTSFNPRAHVGRDRSSSHRNFQRPSFNPRAHVGRDPGRPGAGWPCHVSIHAPTWGATLMNSKRWKELRLFQSTRPRGARPRQADDQRRRKVSIHAPTWGATWAMPRRRSGAMFQSTRPRGARRLCPHTHLFLYKFQSTRPRGARLPSLTSK